MWIYDQLSPSLFAVGCFHLCCCMFYCAVWCCLHLPWKISRKCLSSSYFILLWIVSLVDMCLCKFHNMSAVRSLRFSQHCCWGFKSLLGRDAVFFVEWDFSEWLTVKVEAQCSLKTSGITGWATQHNIPEDLNLNFCVVRIRVQHFQTLTVCGTPLESYPFSFEVQNERNIGTKFAFDIEFLIHLESKFSFMCLDAKKHK